jgi:cell division septal protein FtsQ
MHREQTAKHAEYDNSHQVAREKHISIQWAIIIVVCFVLVAGLFQDLVVSATAQSSSLPQLSVAGNITAVERAYRGLATLSYPREASQEWVGSIMTSPRNGHACSYICAQRGRIG